LSVSIYYRTQSNIRVKSYFRLNLLKASIFNFEGFDILQDSIGHPSKKLLLFEFAGSFRFSFRASRYITGLNQTSELKVIAIRICWELSFLISSVSIYYGTLSDIRFRSYCPLDLLGTFGFNFKRLDILRDSTEHPSKNLSPFEFARNIRF